MSTTIGPSSGVLVMVVLLKLLEKKFDTRGVNNGILSGLVAVTAGAPLVSPEGAFVIGVGAAVVYYGSASLMLKLQIDDVVDAVRAAGRRRCRLWFSLSRSPSSVVGRGGRCGLVAAGCGPVCRRAGVILGVAALGRGGPAAGDRGGGARCRGMSSVRGQRGPRSRTSDP